VPQRRSAPLRVIALALLPVLAACSNADHADDGDEQAVVEAHFTTEAEIAAGKWEGEILDYWKSHSHQSSFSGSPRPDGVQPKIAYDIVSPDVPSQGALVIVHGMTESSVKYAELVYDLHRAGLPLTMYVINHRGHGFSDRLLPDKMKVHVDDFEHYIDDLATFIDTVVEPTKQKNLFAFGHSMGGGILTRYLERYPSTFKYAVLSSPMHGVNTGWVPGGPLRLLLDAVGVFERTDYFPQNAPGGPYTTSPARAKISDTAYRLFPETALGNVTWGWLKEALDDTRGPMHHDVDKITAKIKMFRAAEDNLVSVDAETAVCDAVNKAGHGTCDVVSFEGVRHEVWNERDEIRDQVLTQMLQFMRSKMR
jgi:lysophospholipase